MEGIIKFKGQRYELRGIVPYIRKDGTETKLLQIRGWCAQCGESFDFAVSAKSTNFQPHRRCEKHSRPGRSVKRIHSNARA